MLFLQLDLFFKKTHTLNRNPRKVAFFAIAKRMVLKIIFQFMHKYLNSTSESELTFVSLFHFTIINLLDQTTAKGNLDLLQFVPCQKGCHRSEITITFWTFQMSPLLKGTSAAAAS